MNSAFPRPSSLPYAVTPFDTAFLQSRRQSWLFVMCINFGCAFSVSLALRSFEAAFVNGCLMLSFVLLTYFTGRKNPRQSNNRALNTQRPAANTFVQTLRHKENDELFRRVFDNAGGMALVNREGQWLLANPSLCSLFGYSHEELLTTTFQDVSHPDDAGRTILQIEKLIGGSIDSYQTEQRFTHKLGDTVWMLLNISAVQGSDASPDYLVFQFQDITARKKEEERLVHDVFHDALTGLPNRALLLDRLKFAVERARRRKDQLFAVLFVDLDGFKAINDSLGHIMGDQLLIEVGRRLKTCLRTTDTIARLGGDEFAIVLEDLSSERESLQIVERLQKEFAQPFRLGTSDTRVTASIGMTLSSRMYECAEDMLRDADIAMYEAKSSGKDRHRVFNRELHRPQGEVATLKADLDKAIERRELVVHYQPIASLETGKLLAFESLVRWLHPQRGLIAPNDFIPLAEETGAIFSIGTWVMEEACIQLKQWHEKYPFQTSLAMTVNLCSKQFIQPNLIDQVIEILQKTHLDPRTLKLEITESIVMENIGTSTVVLQQLRALGIDLGVDDFGTGYSSLSYLHRLPINWLKIDKSFVNGMVEKRDHTEIVKTIITLAQSLGIRVVAEGVETLEQLVELRNLKCDAGQGYLFSKPVDAEAAELLLDFGNAWERTVSSLSVNRHNEHAKRFSTTDGVTLQQRRALLRAV